MSTFVAMAAILIAQSSSPVGSYSAVPDNDSQVSLRLLPSGEALYRIVEISEPGTANDSEMWRGRWSLRKTMIHIDLAGHGHINYRLENCLSYGAFGNRGCSFGLQPANYARGALPVAFPFWRDDQFNRTPQQVTPADVPASQGHD